MGVISDNHGRKDDNNKPRMDLLPPDALVEIAKVFTNGAHKYQDRNWERGMDWGRLYAATQRHLNAFWSGEDIDCEWGFSHLAHAGASIIMLLSTYLRNIGNDSRQHLSSVESSNRITINDNSSSSIDIKEEESNVNSASNKDSSYSLKFDKDANVDNVGAIQITRPKIINGDKFSSKKADDSSALNVEPYSIKITHSVSYENGEPVNTYRIYDKSKDKMYYIITKDNLTEDMVKKLYFSKKRSK